MTRVYLPTTPTGLAAAVAAGALGTAPVLAYAVTPALREWYAEGDTEELEYAATTAAARRSLRLLPAEPGGAGGGADAGSAGADRVRRVVVAADVPDGDVAAAGGLDDDPAAVRLDAPVPMTAVASALVDDDLAAADVAAAVAAVPAVDAGDDDAAFTVDGAEGHELAWYAVQEIPDLLG